MAKLRAAPALPSYTYWGDGESVALVSSRVPVESFASELENVFWFRYRRRVVRVLKASLMPSVASSLRPQGLRTYSPVDPSWPLSRWLVWSVALPEASAEVGR